MRIFDDTQQDIKQKATQMEQEIHKVFKYLEV
jgi:hypothetical protein